MRTYPRWENISGALNGSQQMDEPSEGVAIFDLHINNE